MILLFCFFIGTGGGGEGGAEEIIHLVNLYFFGKIGGTNAPPAPGYAVPVHCKSAKKSLGNIQLS